MTYEETIEYLYNSVPMFQKVGAVAYKEGLYNTIKLDEHFCHPHKNFKSIHIAGTNGKGSCSHTLASILQASGYKVGLYTSPHLKDFRERIKVNGECVREEYVIDFIENERHFFEPLHPSFFELTTAMAFKYFAESHVDIAVIEVGLGGRLDCTNIITPVLSIITNISFDHTQFLGDTLAKIATEKAGIIKDNVPVIIGEAVDETRSVFLEKAAENGSEIIFAEDDNEILSAELRPQGGIAYETKDYGKIIGELGGLYQAKNASTILCALKKLSEIGLRIDNEAITAGFANVCETTGLLGRWQKIKETPTVICDTGHNVGGWKYISRQLSMQKCEQMRIVFGMVDDKDVSTVMSLLPKNAIYYFTKPDNKRALDVNTIMEIGKKYGLTAKCFPNVKCAYQQALSESSSADFIFVGGSSYIVADFLSCCV